MVLKSLVMLSCLVGLGLYFFSSTNSSLIYYVHIDKNNPLKAKITVNTNSFHEITMTKPRMMNNDIIPNIQCQKQNGEFTDIVFEQTIKCDKISWDIAFKMASNSGVDVSEQINTYSGDKEWYLLSEWNSLPKIKEATQIDVCVMQQDKDICRSLPPTTSPPLFLVWGEGLKSYHMEIAGLHLNILTDQAELFQQTQQWQSVLSHQLNYLRLVFNINNTKPLTLAWIQREQNAGNIGGAAGNGIYIANVPVDNGMLTSKSLKYLLKISSHELIHFISPISKPIWVRESLAEYYAIQSLQQTEYQHDNPATNWQNSKNNIQFNEIGLYEASVEVSENKSYQYYSLFYIKGAAFWHELDKELGKYNESLSRYLFLLEKDFTLELPTAFVDAITGIIGKKEWDRITKSYLTSDLDTGT